jgi:hypothetical protein
MSAPRPRATLNGMTTPESGRRSTVRARLVLTVLTGLGIAVAGLLVQFAADPTKFGVFPLGIVFIVVAAAIVWLARRKRSAPLTGAAIAAWITFGGFTTGELGRNLTSGDLATAAGNVVMMIGLLLAFVTAVSAVALPASILTSVPGRRG